MSEWWEEDGLTFIPMRDETGFLLRIACPQNGRVIEADPPSLECKKFAEWNKTQPHPLDLQRNGTPAGLLHSTKDLIAHCKASGFLIYAEKPELRCESQDHHMTRDHGLIHRLPVAIALGDDEKGTLRRKPSSLWVTADVFAALNEQLKDEASEIRRVSSLPITRAFAYIDVSDFSKYDPGRQVLIINSIIQTVTSNLYWGSRLAGLVKDGLEWICIGDGYIFVLKNGTDAARFSAYLAYLVEALAASKQLPVPFHFRMGVHVGPVFCFWDPGRNSWNYIGEGINGGKRVLDSIGKDTDDVVFISNEVKGELLAKNDGEFPVSDLIACLHNRGRRADKHGRPWRVHELNHTDLVAPHLPASWLAGRH